LCRIWGFGGAQIAEGKDDKCEHLNWILGGKKRDELEV